VMRPILAPLTLLGRLLTPKGKRAPNIGRGEFKVLADIARREGVIDEDEWRVVQNVVNLDRVAVRETMTARTMVVAIPVLATIEQAKSLMLDEGHSRLPVYDGTIDHVVGVLFARDLWRADRDGVKELRSLMRQPHFVPASRPVDDFLSEMRAEKMKLAIVIDEFGGTAGLVTLEDLVEEIVGSFEDERDIEHLRFEEIGDLEVRIDGSVPISEINERLSLGIPKDIHRTIGGYLCGQLGRIARVGDEVKVENGRFLVLEMDRQRVDRVAFFPKRHSDR